MDEQVESIITGTPEPPDRQPMVACEPEMAAFTREEIESAYRPDRTMDLVLTGWRRLGSNVAERKELGTLVLLLFPAGVLFSLPYGAILGIGGFWRVAALYLGSVAICFPSLQVFGAYLGCRIDLRQNLILALIIPSVAAFFTFGFFPILWFLDATLPAAERSLTSWISLVFLALALLAGIGHLMRTLLSNKSLTSQLRRTYLLIFWQLLLVFITYRMGVTLELA